ncbi:hypothetical protein Ancab_017993 [Ancistrocladus abbreviatus]
MPGTIQISILELTGLPSGTPSSSIRIKVSVGKQVSEAQGKGDFSFPLTTLRDHLIVRIHDFEGNEIAQTVVETRLIVEKGFWDDLFPLEGGGHIHMRLLFVLSEEERNRIHIMRESALRKKQQEGLLKRRLESSAVPSDDSQKIIHQTYSEEVRHADHQAAKSHASGRVETFYKEASTNPRHSNSTSPVKLSISSHAAEVTQQISPEKQESLEKTPSNLASNSAVPKKDDQISSRRENSESDNPVKKGASTGPMGQAIKIAIMVSFGLLVLFTRQRK